MTVKRPAPGELEPIETASRDEIAAFGIDARGFMESRWTIIDVPGGRPFVVKFLAEAKGTERKEFRTSVIQLSCAGPRRVNMILSRGLASHEIGRATSIFLKATTQQKPSPRSRKRSAPTVLR